MSNPETRIQNSALLIVGQRRDCLFWRQHVGKYRHISQPSMIVAIGTPGMADALGVVAVTITQEMVGRTVGVAVAAEFKTETGRQRDVQKLWQHAFTHRGGVYRLVRSDEDMCRMVEDVQRGRW